MTQKPETKLKHGIETTTKDLKSDVNLDVKDRVGVALWDITDEVDREMERPEKSPSFMRRVVRNTLSEARNDIVSDIKASFHHAIWDIYDHINQFTEDTKKYSAPVAQNSGLILGVALLVSPLLFMYGKKQ